MSADEPSSSPPPAAPALPTITRWHDGGFELVVPARGEWARDGFTSGSVVLGADDLNPRIIERHLRVLGWSRSSAKPVANELARAARRLLTSTPA